MQIDFTLSRNAFGRLVLTDAEGVAHEGVAPVRAFPIAAPGEGLALVSTEGRELVWLDSLDVLPPDMRTLVHDELAAREFMPEVLRIKGVSTFATPSTWTVETHRGEASFVLRGEEDIRRLGGQTLLITDNHGIHFLIRDSGTLDKASRKILDRFL
ncbi:hypothetical protein AB870_00945 [Pandoraea faecigallinarum]|uniref:DUF1854 domain-containing protein n=1 Tax=Pandoraea faecigallinarum TaxID=656179 RepID=A0A0H3WMQ8_9BURK|nr:DUF1854 domain-containing protein [Pandoraea faecigallinarum]AKM29002.1 hypothetical protein AB870_00945 [Pandoraea faecigallinarum]